MVLLQNTFEGGTPGGAITAPNSAGGGDQFNGVGQQPVYTTDCFHGTLGFQANAASTTVYWNGFNTATFAARFYFRVLSTPTAAGIICRVYNVNINGDVARVIMTTSRQLQMQDSTGTTRTFNQKVPTLDVGVWYRIEFWGSRGSTTTNGSLEARVYLGDDTSNPVGSSSWVGAFTLGSLNVGRIDFGRLSGTGWGTGPQFDDVAFQDVNAPIGRPLPANNGAYVRSARGVATAGDTVTVPAPSPAAVAGDRIFAFSAGDDQPPTTTATFTTVLDQGDSAVSASGRVQTKSWQKVSSGAEPSSYLFSYGGFVDVAASILDVVGGPVTNTATLTGSSSANGTAVSMNAPSVQGMNGGLLVVVWFVRGDSTSGASRAITTPPSMMEWVDTQDDWVTMSVCSQYLVADGPTGTRTATFSGATPAWRALSFVVSPLVTYSAGQFFPFFG